MDRWMEKSVKSINECFSEGVNELTSFSKRKDSKKKKKKKRKEKDVEAKKVL